MKNNETITVVKRKMTKAEMKATPHTMQGDFAFLADGSQWLWDDRFQWWACWKA